MDILAAITESQKDALIDKLLGGESESDANAEGGDAKQDTAASLIDSVFGSKKDKKKKKKKKEEDGGD